MPKGQRFFGFTIVLIGFFCSQMLLAETTKQTTAEKVDYRSYSAGQWKSGEQIYQAFCIHCHQTSIGPEILGRHYSPLALTVLVRNGINTMPTFRTSEINDQELSTLANWVEQSSALSAGQPVEKSGRKK